ncbi:Hpt domain-containing protein [Spirosoma spitsbergense]|uniref:Hpt domain-containing protein n=1 Tax=Spirosoma spitsbergense TaxID=431554 RepID=UPI00035E912B|nr:Hpt domain-containing protein [Spirosoma spitsbergense]
MNVSDYPKNPPPTQPEDRATDTAWYANSSAPSDLGLRNSVEAGPCFQLATLLQAVDNEQALALELLELVLAQTPGEVLALEQALIENDLGSVGRIIHSQKASFEVFGLLEVVRLGRALEQQLARPKAEGDVSVLIRQYAGMLRAELVLMQLVLQTAAGGDLP